MAGNPRVVTADVAFTWDGVTQKLSRGQVLDVTPGSALEQAIGRERLVPFGAVSAQPAQPAEGRPQAAGAGVPSRPPAPAQPVSVPAETEQQGTAPRPRAAARKQDSDDKEAGS